MLMCFENCRALKQRPQIIIVSLNTQVHNSKKKKIELKCHGNLTEAEITVCWI